MRVPPAEYLRLKLRAHELLQGVPLYDVSVMDRNATVHGYVSVTLARTATGYRLYWAVYVLPGSWLTRPYLMAIEPFRRFMLYPAMLRRIRCAWLAVYGASG